MRFLLFTITSLISILLFHTVAYGVTFFESYLISEDNYLEFAEVLSGAQYGSSLSSGDINGDGYEDVIIGAPFASTGDKKWNGMVSVILGSDSFQQKQSYLSSNIKFFGESSGDQLGSSLSVGDYNNDGVDDIAIGAYNAYSDEERVGKVYVIYGKWTWSSQNFDFALHKPDVTLTGDYPGGAFGLSLFSSDFNNDQIDDLFVGAPFSSNMTSYISGSVYEYHGSKKGLSDLFSSIYHGQRDGDRFGSALSMGDINGDGFKELIVGAYLAGVRKDNMGAVYIYEYSPKSVVSNAEASHILTSEEENSWFGFSLFSGDLNNDGVDDLLVGSFPFFKDRSSDKITVYYGGEKFGLLTAFTIDDSMDEILIASSIRIADLDMDGLNDIIIGAPGVGDPYSQNEGNVYILYGKNLEQSLNDTSDILLKDVDGFSLIHGFAPDDWFGSEINTLDFNNDGIVDLLIGSRYSDSENSVNDGRVFLIFGDGAPFGNEKIIEDNDYVITRGEFISEVLDRFDIKTKKESIIRKCYDFRDFCLFNFTAMSSYEDITLEPEIILYPDIQPLNRYYEDVIAGTMLGLINGYLAEENSPFHPERPISRIQALKVILGASDLVVPKYRFELIDLLGSLENLNSQKSYFLDINLEIFHMWWYPRYVNFAVENNIIEDGEFFRPDENITKEELNDMIDKTLALINSSENEET